MGGKRKPASNMNADTMRQQGAVRPVRRSEGWPQPHIIAGGPLQRKTPPGEGQFAISHAAERTDCPQLSQVQKDKTGQYQGRRYCRW
ncbi:hypothetical protein TNIN_66661 [Trichonephila inaurata madagascariensis]|uniref:Uncharacterized protein n=1 Tax=Trichonephila inaurata madagascariensis TaxID=2747483 RepID=A0A8X6X297_9ARAC|nr:hypothetical protein TNIN_66661 [Trichonephila inaurata madagascariensis]